MRSKVPLRLRGLRVPNFFVIVAGVFTAFVILSQTLKFQRLLEKKRGHGPGVEVNCRNVKDTTVIECLPSFCTTSPSSSLPKDYRTVTLSPTLTMVIYPPGELISDSIIRSSLTYCPGEITRLLQEAQLQNRRLHLLDVGSNIGSCALVAASMGHSAVSIEPMEQNIALIKESSKRSPFPSPGKLTIFPIAASDELGELLLLKEKNNSGNNIVLKNNDDKSALRSFGSFQKLAEYEDPEHICTVPLDQIRYTMPGSFQPDIIKIDVQGHEVLALRGMQDILRQRTATYVFMEVWPTLLRQKNQDPLEIYTIAKAINYKIVAKQKEVTNTAEWEKLCQWPWGFDIEMSPN